MSRERRKFLDLLKMMFYFPIANPACGESAAHSAHMLWSSGTLSNPQLVGSWQPSYWASHAAKKSLRSIASHCNILQRVTPCLLLSTCLLTDLSMDSFNWVMIVFRGKNMVILLNIMLYKFVGVARFPIETIPCIYWRWCLICPRLIPLLGGQRRVEGVGWIILVVSWNGGSPSHHRFQY